MYEFHREYIEKTELIYKYTNDSTAFRLLENNTLQFKSPQEFNDPFECYPNFVNYPDTTIKKFFANFTELFIADEKFPENIKTLLATNFGTSEKVEEFRKTMQNILAGLTKNIGITCFSEICDSLLMWSHYGRNHAGICIGYSTSELYKYLYPKYKAFFLKVKYSTRYPSIINTDIEKDFDYIYDWLSHKSLEWEYEKEVRLVRTSGFDIDTKLVDIPKSAVREIILGCKIDPIKQNQITELIKNKYCPNVKLYKMKMSKTAFMVEKKPILII